ncbi:tyrosine-type recombinase/integrase [Citromicrobium bathyomarinum]|uniref:tyrosine-type recombinase/integrase n=1 Tax=Citromicrobium bathyomarinum TaxID=72174 RepID=UPI001E320098|nr:site-specific integrase [Citromicrobium bathyomarinum]MCD1624181.1 site-specific integrase [Citromicrobium bathyomarinum]
MAVTKLTEARIRDLALGSGIHRDTEVKGLMVICHKTTKSYAVQGDVRRNGRHVRTVRVKIDRVDRIGLRDARNRARVLMSQIQSGVDPTDGPDETGITLSAALDAHLEEKQRRPRTVEGYRYHLNHYLKNWRNKAVADISRQMVRDLFADLKRKHGEPTAASVMRTLRAVINTAMRIDESLEGNPVAALRVPTTRRRKVAPLDLREWWGKVMELTPARRDLHVAMLLTGARRSSILNVRRQDVDVERGVLTLTHMKTSDEPLSLPIGWRLSKVLNARMEADRPLGSEWLWPSPTSRSGHIEEPKERGLPSPHEYRHHARTLYIQAGVGYAESALLLGQKLPGASGGYVHAEHLVEHLRKHAQALEDLVFAAAHPGFTETSDGRVVDPMGFTPALPAPE